MKFNELHGIPALFCDFVENAASCRPLLPSVPTAEDLRQKAGWIGDQPYPRHRVGQIFEMQSRCYKSGDSTLGSIKRLQEPRTVSVLFDLPVQLFGGPLSLLLRCVTARKLVTDLERIGVSAVPIAWLRPCGMQTGGRGSIKVLDEGGSLKEIKLSDAGASSWHQIEKGELSEEIVSLLVLLEQYLGRHAQPDVMDLLRREFSPGVTLSAANGAFYSELLREWGIVVFDPSDHAIQELVQPLLAQIAGRGVRTASLIEERLSALKDSGYAVDDMSPQVAESLQDLLHSSSLLNPAGQSPHGAATLSMFLMPLCLGALLPVLTVLADPWQLDEFTLLYGLYPEFGLAAPPLFPCLSASILDARNKNLLSKYELSISDLFIGEDEVIRKHGIGDRASAARAGLEELIQETDRRLSSLVGEIRNAGNIRASIEESREKVHFQLGKLLEKLAQAAGARQEAEKRQITRLCNALAPGGFLQEREIASIFFLSRHSLGLHRLLEAGLELWKFEHQLITVD